MFLSLTNIKKSFGQGDSRVEVLKGIDLSIEKGEFCVLLGPSGSGKSTLLNIIGGIDRADSGQITIEGELMEKMTVKRLSQYLRKADSAVSSDAKKDQVYQEVHLHPMHDYLSKHRPQYYRRH